MNAGEMQSARPTKTWRVPAVELAVGEPESLLRERVCRDLGLAPSELVSFRIVKKALDARVRNGVRRLQFAIHVDIVVDAAHRGAAFARARRSGRVFEAPARVEPRVEHVHPSLTAAGRAPVVVVGAGPGGLFAAYVLARHGVEVTLVDRGSPVERRSRELVRFHRTRVPNAESNLLFGEGGAGTYSDGKLYTRVDDPLEVPLLEEWVACGAQPEILFDSRAHIGTDRLHRVLPAFRKRLEAAGVRLVWNTRVDALVFAPGAVRTLRALETTSGEIACSAVILSPGHSARDTWHALSAQGVVFAAKPFQLGVRIEHPQEWVDAMRYGTSPEARSLGRASYQLVARADEAGPSLHSFCMCPGGRIVASVNEAGYLCTNGMSDSKHSSRYANAAVVTTFGPREFGPGAFAGVAFQREIEARFFEAGGADYTAPAQTAADFMAGRESRGPLSSSYALGTRPARIDLLLPRELRDGLRRALARFDRSMSGFAGEQGLFVGIESRSSGPVRMPRDPTTRRAEGITNLYPVGEGAGYAGGIMSAALDGAHSALALLQHGL